MAVGSGVGVGVEVDIGVGVAVGSAEGAGTGVGVGVDSIVGAGPGFTVGAWVGVGLGITAVAVGGASVGWASSGSQATDAAINASIAIATATAPMRLPQSFFLNLAKVCINLLPVMVPPAGFEPTHLASEASTLSSELRGLAGIHTGQRETNCGSLVLLRSQWGI